MTKRLKFALFFVILLLISKSLNKRLNSTREMILNSILEKYGTLRSAKFKMVYDALKGLNLTPIQLNFTLSQIMQETGVFIKTGGVFDKNSNASGITWTGSSNQIATGATKGTARPLNEGLNTFYAKYPNLDSWAKDYLRILNKGSQPLNAKDVTDFVHRLKQNGYFTASESVYLKNVQNYFNLINNA